GIVQPIEQAGYPHCRDKSILLSHTFARNACSTVSSSASSISSLAASVLPLRACHMPPPRSAGAQPEKDFCTAIGRLPISLVGQFLSRPASLGSKRKTSSDVQIPPVSSSAELLCQWCKHESKTAVRTAGRSEHAKQHCVRQRAEHTPHADF